MYKIFKRLLDLSVAIVATIFFLIPATLVSLAIKLTSQGPILHWSNRIGKNNIIFKMPKFRTMRIDTPDVATHLLENPDRFITPIGKFLRKTSLDELPQLWSILTGDMSLVGPRPALHNQFDLVELRTKHQVHTLCPGLTGLAQISGRDELSIPKKVTFDAEYLQKQTFWLDMKILFLTFSKVLKSQNVSH
jgi:O-antigen biosynthesis protein WbqP